ncbi:MAG: hypothetical protein AVDCRST_MAG11-1901, partial [uncultured Gemmatimonadaceae bacterium]
GARGRAAGAGGARGAAPQGGRGVGRQVGARV